MDSITLLLVGCIIGMLVIVFTRSSTTIVVERPIANETTPGSGCGLLIFGFILVGVVISLLGDPSIAGTW